MCTAFVKRDGQQWPCGKCHSCRINRKRDWQARLLLEAASSAFSAFLTLTIEVKDAHKDSYCTYLDKRTVQLFLKRLRRACSGVSIRYLIVGEYGEKFGRAHYHALVFSTAPLAPAVVIKAWGFGSVDFGDVQQESIDYCLAYVLKGRSDCAHLAAWDGERRRRHPEFRLYSQGLGRAALPSLCVADRETGELVLQREFRVLGRSWPIGRYFRQRYRGGTATALHDAGVADCVAESRFTLIERALYEKLRTLSPGTEAYRVAVSEIQKKKEAALKVAQGRRIRDYYRNLHQLSEKGRKNETF